MRSPFYQPKCRNPRKYFNCLALPILKVMFSNYIQFFLNSKIEEGIQSHTYFWTWCKLTFNVVFIPLTSLTAQNRLIYLETPCKNTNNFLRKVFSQTIISYVSSYNKRLTWIRLRLREQGSESPQFCWIFDNSWPGQG